MMETTKSGQIKKCNLTRHQYHDYSNVIEDELEDATMNQPPSSPDSPKKVRRGPRGIVALYFAQTPIAQQQELAHKMYTNLTTGQWDTSHLEDNPLLVPFLLAMPDTTREVRVIYGLGALPTDEEKWKDSPIIDNVLALHGEALAEIAPPEIMILPDTMLLEDKVKAPQEDAFEMERLADDPKAMRRTYFFRSNEVATTHPLMKAYPIPAYLVYDGFEADIKLLTVYERVQHALLDPHCKCKEALRDILIFVRACYTSSTQKDTKPRLAVDEFVVPTHVDALRWRHTRIDTLFPGGESDDEEQEPTELQPSSPPSIARNTGGTPPSPSSLESTTRHDPGSAPSPSPPSSPHSSTTTAKSSTRATAGAPTTAVTLSTAPTTPASKSRKSTLGFTAAATRAWTTPKRASTPRATSTATPSTITADPTLTTGVSGNVTMSESALIRLVREIQKSSAATAVRGGTADTTAEGSDDSDDETTAARPKACLGLDKAVFQKLLLMCGLTPAAVEHLPKLWERIHSKGLTKIDKADIIRATLDAEVHFPGNKVPQLQALITMIRERNFEGETNSSSLSAATKGLTPFALPSLTDQEIDAQNDLAIALAQATATTVKDVNATKSTATAPRTLDGLVRQLKRYGNLLFAIFGDLCPLFLQIIQMVRILEDYGDVARASVSQCTIASILWVLLLQSRHFARGRMKGPLALLPEFQQMMSNLSMRLPIAHGDVPPALYKSSYDGSGAGTKRPFGGDGDDKGDKRDRDRDAKKRRLANKLLRNYDTDRAEVYSGEMKKAMKPIFALDFRPSVFNICKAAKVSLADLFPKHPNLCVKAQVYGACDSKCRYEHKKLAADEITAAIGKLQPAFDNPRAIKGNKKV